MLPRILSLLLVPAALALAPSAAAQGAPAPPGGDAPPLPPLPPASSPDAPPLPAAASPDAPPSAIAPPDAPPPDAPPPVSGSAAPPGSPTYLVDTAPPPPDPFPTRMNSPTFFISGIVTESVGFIGFVTGLGLLYSTPGGCTQDCPPLTEAEQGRRDAGAALMLGGGILVALGIPMLIYGARKVPDKPSWAGAPPAVLVGPQGGALRWAF